MSAEKTITVRLTPGNYLLTVMPGGHRAWQVKGDRVTLSERDVIGLGEEFRRLNEESDSETAEALREMEEDED
jgi:2-keto-3-deoxy-galactonokinase